MLSLALNYILHIFFRDSYCHQIGRLSRVRNNWFPRPHWKDGTVRQIEGWRGLNPKASWTSLGLSQGRYVTFDIWIKEHAAVWSANTKSFQDTFQKYCSQHLKSKRYYARDSPRPPLNLNSFNSTSSCISRETKDVNKNRNRRPGPGSQQVKAFQEVYRTIPQLPQAIRISVQGLQTSVCMQFCPFLNPDLCIFCWSCCLS